MIISFRQYDILSKTRNRMTTNDDGYLVFPPKWRWFTRVHHLVIDNFPQGEGLLGLIFAKYVPLSSQGPYPIIVYFVSNYRPHLSHLLSKCNFRDPNLVTFYLFISLILNEEHFTFHLQYKHSGTFANCKCEELFYPKNQKMCDPILVLVTLLKMRPHYSQSSR